MGQQSMNKPPTKAEPSAEEEGTPEALADRVLRLAQDCFLAYRDNPTEESLDLFELLSAIGSSPERRKQLANELRRLRNREAGTEHTFWRKVWLKQVPLFTAYHHGDPEAVARDLIIFAPSELRVRCPNYPTGDTELDGAVSAVVSARNFGPELAMWRACGDIDVLKVARAVLRGLGMSKDEAKSLLPASQWAEIRSSNGSSSPKTTKPESY